MHLIFIITFSITIIYCIIILSFLYGWEKIPIFQKGLQSSSDVYISVIIALRNEENNVQSLLGSLMNQSLSSNSFEIILIDDNSSDRTFDIISQKTLNSKNIKIIKSGKNSGKKQGIILGIHQSKGQLIVTTDADCIHHKQWLKTIHDFYLKSKPKMIIGPVIMQSKNFFENIQAIDFYSLMVSGAGASGIQKPIMCNGANLAFEKEILKEFTDPLKNKQISGDDIFMLLNLKKKYATEICFLKSEEAIVHTKAESNLNQFLEQRKRWASKSKGYRDLDIIITALVVLLTNILILGSLIISIMTSKFDIVFIGLFLLKCLIDFSFLAQTNRFFKQTNLLCYFLPTQILNLIFIPYIAFTGIIGTIKWKGRIYN